MSLKKRGLRALADFFSRRKTPEAPPTQTSTVSTEAQSLEDEIRKSPLTKERDPFLPAPQKQREIAPSRVRLEQEELDEQINLSKQRRKRAEEKPFEDVHVSHRGVSPVEEYSTVPRDAMPSGSSLYQYISAHPSDKPLAAKEWIRYLKKGIQKGDRVKVDNPNLKNIDTSISKEELADSNLLVLEPATIKPTFRLKKFDTKPIDTPSKFEENLEVGGYLKSAESINAKLTKEELLGMVADQPMARAKVTVLGYQNVPQIVKAIDDGHEKLLELGTKNNAIINKAIDDVDSFVNLTAQQKEALKANLMNLLVVPTSRSGGVTPFTAIQTLIKEGNQVSLKPAEVDVMFESAIRHLYDNLPSEDNLLKQIKLPGNNQRFGELFGENKKMLDTLFLSGGTDLGEAFTIQKEIKKIAERTKDDVVGSFSNPKFFPSVYGNASSYRITGGEEYIEFVTRVPDPQGVIVRSGGHYGTLTGPDGVAQNLRQQALAHTRGHIRFTKDGKKVFLIDEHQLDKQQKIGVKLARKPELRRLNPYNRDYFDNVAGSPTESLVTAQKKKLLEQMTKLDKGVRTSDADLQEIERIRDRLANVDGQKKFHNLDNNMFVEEYNKLLNQEGIEYQPMLQEHRNYTIKMLSKYFAKERPDIDYIGVVPSEISGAAKGRGTAADFSQYGTFLGKAGARLDGKVLRGQSSGTSSERRLTKPDQDSSFMKAMKSFAKNYNGKIVKVDVARSDPKKQYKVLAREKANTNTEGSDLVEQRLKGMKIQAHGPMTEPYVEHLGAFKTDAEAESFKNLAGISGTKSIIPDSSATSRSLYDKYILLELPKDLDKTPVKIYKSKGGLVVDLFKW
tara:strand:- start:7532 stop:10072 length:2541 start_codon:yes stop_codon:yes gene_type:complete